MATLTTIMPPIVDTFQQAFVCGDSSHNAVVYFSIADYSSALQDGWKIHFTVRSQIDNENVLNPSVAPTGIKIITYDKSTYYDTDKQMYKITLLGEDIIGDTGFTPDTNYVIQLRIDTNTSEIGSTAYDITAYLQNASNQASFSEWSTQTLIKAIYKPVLTIDQFAAKNPVFNWGSIHLSGVLAFYNGAALVTSTEHLQYYNIQILSLDGETEYYDSGNVYTTKTTSINEINYILNCANFLSQYETGNFIFRLTYHTSNDYVGRTKDSAFVFTIGPTEEDPKFEKTIFSATPDNEKGIVTLSIQNDEELFGILYIRRASIADNFKTWEEIREERLNGSYNITYIDRTVESMNWYRYSIQYINYKGIAYQSMVAPGFDEDPAFVNFTTDMFVRLDKQLPMLYDFKINSDKPNVSFTKVETLGSKYPKFLENGMMNYHQYGITAKIAAESDVFRMFLDEDDYFDDSITLYEDYKSNYGVLDVYRNDYKDVSIGNHYEALGMPEVTTPMNDVLWERIFRNHVVEWLNDGEAKLLKTQAEGNRAVILSDISLTPNAQLGRRIYDLTATAYEIGDATLLTSLAALQIIDMNVQDLSVNPNVPTYVTKSRVGQKYFTDLPVKDGYKSLYAAVLADFENEFTGINADVAILNDKLYFTHVKFFITAIQITTEQINNETVVRTNRDFCLTREEAETSPITMNIPDSLNVNDVVYYKEATNDELTDSTIFKYHITTSSTYELVTQEYVNSHPEEIYYIKLNSLLYQIPSTTIATNVLPNVNWTGYVEYVVTYNKCLSESSTGTVTSIDRTVVGQVIESNGFQYDEGIADTITSKHFYTYTSTDGKQTYIQKVETWKGISVDSNSPLAIVQCEYADEEIGTQTYLTGYDGFLGLRPNSVVHYIDGQPYIISDNYDLKELKFMGRKFIIIDSGTTPREHECILAGTIRPEQPSLHYVYQIKENETITGYEIMMNNNYFPPCTIETIEKEGKTYTFVVAVMPITATVNYLADVIQRTKTYE